MNEETKNGGPAFPSEQHETQGGELNQTYEPGMSLRDYFAAKAMQSIIVCETDFDTHELRAEFAYRQADEMLKAREQSS
jgi:hypothetical protein